MMKVSCEESALSCARLLLGAWSALICLSQGIRLHPFPEVKLIRFCVAVCC